MAVSTFAFMGALNCHIRYLILLLERPHGEGKDGRLHGGEWEVQQEMRPQIYNLHQVQNKDVNIGTSFVRGSQDAVREMKK